MNYFSRTQKKLSHLRGKRIQATIKFESCEKQLIECKSKLEDSIHSTALVEDRVMDLMAMLSKTTDALYKIKDMECAYMEKCPDGCRCSTYADIADEVLWNIEKWRQANGS